MLGLVLRFGMPSRCMVQDLEVMATVEEPWAR